MTYPYAPAPRLRHSWWRWLFIAVWFVAAMACVAFWGGCIAVAIAALQHFGII